MIKGFNICSVVILFYNKYSSDHRSLYFSMVLSVDVVTVMVDMALVFHVIQTVLDLVPVTAVVQE